MLLTGIRSPFPGHYCSWVRPCDKAVDSECQGKDYLEFLGSLLYWTLLFVPHPAPPKSPDRLCVSIPWLLQDLLLTAHTYDYRTAV